MSHILAFFAGLLPVMIWLFFWLKQDSKNPEPRHMIFLAFLAGMTSVFLVLPIEKQIFEWFATGTVTLILWAFAEEAMKYVLAYILVLRNKNNNEPLDPVIYLITAALGFAALENTLFLIDPITFGATVESIITGNLRFIGATLLHTLASGTLGTFLAFVYYKRRSLRRLTAVVGLLIATVLHTLFNFFIMKSSEHSVFLVFISVWSGIIFLILIFERIKRMRVPYQNMRMR